MIAILILYGFLTLKFLMQGINFRDIPFVDNHADQLACFIKDGTSRNHQLTASAGILEHCRRRSGFNHFQGGGSVDESLCNQVCHVATNHFGGANIVQALRGGIDSQHRRIGVADPQSIVG